ncbi:hypothetical protein D3C87_1270500 [compost metagenome]
MHRSVVIARGDAFDVVASVVGLDRAFRAEHHAGGHRRFAAGVADVVTLQTLRWLVQVQHFGQGIETCGNMLPVGQSCTQGLLGIGDRQLLPACPGPTDPVTDGQFATAQLVDGCDQGRKVFVNHIDDQLARQVAFGTADVVLTEKRRHDFRYVFFNTHLREEVLAPQHSPAAHADQVHAGTAGIDERRDHVDIARTAFHALLILDPAQQRDLVAQLGGTLEFEVDRRLLHGDRQFVRQRIAAPLEEHHRVPYVFGVDFGLHQTDARCLAAFDLVLQARPRAVLVIAVFALAYEKGFLQQAQAFANRPGAGIRTEVLTLGLFRPAMDAQARECAVREKDVGVGFVVAQQNVVGRPPLLDQRLLKQQGFGFIGRDRRFDLGDTRHQGRGLGGEPGLAKVARQTTLEVLGLADVEQARIAVEHAIHTGTPTDRRQKGAWIKGFSHVQRLASTMP